MASKSLSRHGGATRGLPLTHLGLAILVAAIWGTNFVVAHIGLEQFPPLTFGALRFAVAGLVLAPFLPRPKVRWTVIFAYGLSIGVGQFGLLFFAMAHHIAPGLASLLMQTQVFFTIGLAAALMGERVRRSTLFALLLCGAGVALIGLHTGGDADAAGIAMILGSAFAWSVGNLVAKQAGAIDMLGLVVWSSLVAAPALAVLALLTEGPAAMVSSITGAGFWAWITVLWQSFGNTVFGYGVWNWLLARHPAADVAPTALLIPVFGLSASIIIVGEQLPLWKIEAALLVLMGLAINLLVGRWKS